jgi:ADP-ribose pyrophosphatase YjhB (NUDIX family)
MAVVHNSSNLLAKYRWAHDEQADWFLPNDGLSHAEHREIDVKRILKERLGIENATLKLVEIESFIGNNKSGHPLGIIVIAVFHLEPYVRFIFHLRNMGPRDTRHWELNWGRG